MRNSYLVIDGREWRESPTVEAGHSRGIRIQRIALACRPVDAAERAPPRSEAGAALVECN